MRALALVLGLFAGSAPLAHAKELLNANNTSEKAFLEAQIAGKTMTPQGAFDAAVGCTDKEIRLDKNFELPIYDQHSSGHCYASGSAVCVDYYLKATGKLKGSGAAVSPVQLAALYKTDPDIKVGTSPEWGDIAANIGGGDPTFLFGKLADNAEKLTLCTSRGVDKVFHDYMQEHYGKAFAAALTTEDFMKYLERMYGAYWYYFGHRDNSNIDMRLTHESSTEYELDQIEQDFAHGQYAAGNAGVVNPDKCSQVAQEIQPTVKQLMKDMGEIQKAYDKDFDGKKSLVAFLRAKIDEKCPAEERVSGLGKLPKPRHAAEDSAGGKSALRNFLSEQLCRAGQSAAIQICAEGFLLGNKVLNAKGDRARCTSKCSEGAGNKPRTCQNADHVVAVVGRRVSAGKTEYLVQNSWGAADCKSNGYIKDSCDPSGRFWVSETELVDRMTTAVGFDTKSGP